jgi:uncharacterized protein (DUF433 family)
MTDRELLQRITCSPDIMVGKPVIRGTRITIDFVPNLLAHGSTIAEVLSEYEGLEEGDIRAVLLFASRFLSNATFVPVTGSRK